MRGPVLLECQGVGASPWRDRPAARSDWSSLRSCTHGKVMEYIVFGPRVTKNGSLGLVNIDMIKAPPPTKALLKPNNFKALPRSRERSESSAYGPTSLFCTRAIALRCRDNHKSWSSCLRWRCQWPSGRVYESMCSCHLLQTCLHFRSRHMLSSVAGRVSIILLRVSGGWP